jgi:hypothetical protein
MRDAELLAAAEDPDLLVNLAAIARLVVLKQLAGHMSAERVRQLAAPASERGDPEFPSEVPHVGSGRWYRWGQVEAYWRRRDPTRVNRRYRRSTGQATPAGDGTASPGPAVAP